MYLICKEAKVKDQIKSKGKKNKEENFDLRRKGLVINENAFNQHAIIRIIFSESS